MGHHRVVKIISGGQTGVDRAALDVALELGIPCGGWCPKGRDSEDGRIDDRYPLRETQSEDPAERTNLNVRDSDATLIISPKPLTGGTALTQQYARELDRPVLVVEPDDPQAAEKILQWLSATRPRVLNIAGPRASGFEHAKDSLAAVHTLLRSILRQSRRVDSSI